MIPLAIIRDKQEGKNEIPVVLINPTAETQLIVKINYKKERRQTPDDGKPHSARWFRVAK